MSEINMEISIPADEEGYILLKCPLCKELFKVSAEYLNQDEPEVWCPSCGMKSDNYLTDDVIELANQKIENAVQDLLYKEMKKMERQFSKGNIKFSAGKKPRAVEENSLNPSIDTLAEKEFKCCNKSAKIPEILTMGICYCPFCGVMTDEY